MELSKKEILLVFAAIDEILHQKKIIYQPINGAAAEWFIKDLEATYSEKELQDEDSVVNDMYKLYNKILKEVGVYE
ncbi:hypothetical protein Staley_87 [Bacillus phage Staley]|uniref:Uncharacterized protein n=1 Tax=Bacillus phage Staley TaxID=1406792 RepID=U5PXN4_9CAUD|nr:hypothetical protein Staley_87 [Bacillus phage Staley]AGY48770.1 hypothetical protein Staley_87 [Bacillus phage Staley]